MLFSLLVGWPWPGTCGRPRVAPGRSSPAGAVPNRTVTAAAPHGEEARPIRAAHWPVRRPRRRRPRVPALPGRRGPAHHRLGRAGTGPPADRAGGAGRAALAGRRTALLRSLCDAGGLAEADAGLLQLTPLGREFLDLPDAAQLGFVFA